MIFGIWLCLFDKCLLANVVTTLKFGFDIVIVLSKMVQVSVWV